MNTPLSRCRFSPFEPTTFRGSTRAPQLPQRVRWLRGSYGGAGHPSWRRRRGAERRCVNKSQSAAASLRDGVPGGRVVCRGIRSLWGPAVALPLVATISTGTLQLAQRTQPSLVNLTGSSTEGDQDVVTLPKLAPQLPTRPSRHGAQHKACWTLGPCPGRRC